MPLTRNGKIIEDRWTAVAADAPLPGAGDILVRYARWRDDREALRRHGGKVGVRLASDESPALIAEDLDRFDLIALEFPTFKDGRAYSHARLLRERYGYRKELRAVGNVLRDQYLFLHRCGFDTLEIADAAAADTWSDALSEISVAYQPAADRRPWVTALRQANHDTDAAAE